MMKGTTENPQQGSAETPPAPLITVLVPRPRQTRLCSLERRGTG